MTNIKSRDQYCNIWLLSFNFFIEIKFFKLSESKRVSGQKSYSLDHCVLSATSFRQMISYVASAYSALFLYLLFFSQLRRSSFFPFKLRLCFASQTVSLWHLQGSFIFDHHLCVYSSVHMNELKVLHKAEETWFLTACRSLKTDYFDKKYCSPVQYAFFDTSRAKFGQLFTP